MGVLVKSVKKNLPARTITMTEDEFDEEYMPVPVIFGGDENLFDDFRGDSEAGMGALLERAKEISGGDEFDAPRHIWTMIDGDNGGLYIVSGMTFVNRIGYIVTQKPWPKRGPDGEEVFVNVDCSWDDEDTEKEAAYTS